MTTSETSTQTSCMDVKEVYLPQIPDTKPELEEHIRMLCNYMDQIGRQREAAKQKLEQFRREEPSLQKERELRRKLESENRELKRQIAEIKWRDNLFAQMEP